MNKSPGFLLIVLFGMIVCLFANPASTEALDSRNFKNKKDTMGVVLLDANWGRSWECGGYDNAQLVSFTFDRIDDDEPSMGDEYSSILVKTRSRLLVDPAFQNYGFLVQPGVYGLTGVRIKIARSSTDVFWKVLDKEQLMSNGEYPGGTFRVDAGEVVYIGNFWLDCLESPIIWRYYTEGAENFANHVAEYKKKFKYLRDSDVVYRLFSTATFGSDYEL